MNCTGQAELLVLVQLRQFASERDALLAQLANIATHSPMSPDADQDQIGRSVLAMPTNQATELVGKQAVKRRLSSAGC